MPQPKKSEDTKQPPVRGDATAAPTPATAPSKSSRKAVADEAATRQAPASRAARAKRPPATTKGGAPRKPPVRGDATAAPAPATAPAKSTRKAVARSAAEATPSAREAATKRGPARTAKPRPAAARPKAAPAGRAAKPRPAAAPAPAPEPTSAAARDEALLSNLAALRDLLAGGVVLTAQRLQEAVDEAVTRGRITRRDAEDLAGGLLAAGRQQTADLVADLEQLLGRGRTDLTSARSITKGAVKGSSDRVLREVDRARRVAGLGPSFPILGYDDLTAAQITARLGELTPAELRKVRDHERATADRATVLEAVEQALG